MSGTDVLECPPFAKEQLDIENAESKIFMQPHPTQDQDEGVSGINVLFSGLQICF